MDRIHPNQIPGFMKRFGFLKGSLARFAVRNRSAQAAVGELRLRVREGEEGRPVRVRLSFEGVEEYRFQRRPGAGLVRLRRVRLGYFGGLFYLNLDAFTDDAAPQLMDFRASDAYIAGREVSWEVVSPGS